MTDEIEIDGVDVSECRHCKNKSCIVNYLLTNLAFSDANVLNDLTATTNNSNTRKKNAINTNKH